MFAWPDFLGGVTGRVKTSSKSIFCAGKNEVPLFSIIVNQPLQVLVGIFSYYYTTTGLTFWLIFIKCILMCNYQTHINLTMCQCNICCPLFWSLLDCPLVESSVSQLRSSSKAVNPGSKVQFSCSPGFYLVGEPVQQCLNRGQWSHAEPICERE